MLRRSVLLKLIDSPHTSSVYWCICHFPSPNDILQVCARRTVLKINKIYEHTVIFDCLTCLTRSWIFYITINKLLSYNQRLSGTIQHWCRWHLEMRYELINNHVLLIARGGRLSCNELVIKIIILPAACSPEGDESLVRLTLKRQIEGLPSRSP